MSRRVRRRPVPEGEFNAAVIDLDHDGRGVARVDGKVTFIAGALPGEQVRYKLRRVTRDVDEADMTGVETASPQRVEPRCAHFGPKPGACGGCVLQHLAPEAQVAFKQKQILDALQRIGGVQPEEIAAPVTAEPWGYRRRARLGVKRVPKKGGVLVGFRERDTPLLAAIDACVVLDPRVGTKLRELGQLIGELSIAAELPQIEVATADSVALVLRVMREPSAEDMEMLHGFGREQGFDFYLQRGGLDTIKPIGAAPALRYSPDASELQLEFGPVDFVQVNLAVSQQMVQQAIAWLQPQTGDEVLELFAGLGNFTAPLVKTGARVTAVEGDAELVRRGDENLRRSGLEARFLRSDLFVPDAQAPWLTQRYDLALLDPPRSGAREVLPFVAAGGPRRIAYISCHPGTLARDAGELVKMHGYRLVRAGVLDMFPHTAHVESMALFEK
jgi:23S rRNA (uracil1939-C5)-methyltransferase